jgi:integrase
LPRIRVHDLRHTTATVLLQAGIHPKVVQELLGHKTVATTLDTYSHVPPVLHRDAVRVLEDWLGGPKVDSLAATGDFSHKAQPDR